tara:strand:- start:3949 stop:4887 length:939 start_codon:yes stop_codon:yes gene_type:complete
VKLKDINQGTALWKAWRKSKLTGSNAPAMMGESPYTKREDLLTSYTTGYSKPVGGKVQDLFNKGHQAEEAARPIVAELMTEVEKTPITLEAQCCEMEDSDFPEGTPAATLEILKDKLACSLDGMTEDGSIIFEHKLWNKKLAQAIDDQQLPQYIMWQLEHNLMVSGAKRCIFVTSDGTPAQMKLLEYHANPLAQAALLEGWVTFLKDAETHEPVDIVDATKLPEWVSGEEELFSIDSQIASLEQRKGEIRQQLEDMAAGRKMVGNRYMSITTKSKGTISYKNAVVANNPDWDLEEYRSQPSTTFQLRRVKSD